jgi:hypothetical protein
LSEEEEKDPESVSEPHPVKPFYPNPHSPHHCPKPSRFAISLSKTPTGGEYIAATPNTPKYVAAVSDL